MTYEHEFQLRLGKFDIACARLREVLATRRPEDMGESPGNEDAKADVHYKANEIVNFKRRWADAEALVPTIGESEATTP